MRVLFLFIILSSCFSALAQETSNPFAETFYQYARDYKIDRSNEDGPLSPADTVYIDFFEPDRNYVLNAKVERLENGDTITMMTVNGKKKQYIKYAYLHFTLKGINTKLLIFQSLKLMRNPLYRNYLFLPFYDNSNGDSTYGGGRYMELSSLDIKDNSLELDFNRCFNPYCAYTTGYSCPIPPEENSINTFVLAGEKVFRKE